MTGNSAALLIYVKGDILMKKLTKVLLAILALAIVGGSQATWIF